MSHVFPVNNVFREDVVTNGDGSKETLSNAPAQKDGGFKVPKDNWRLIRLLKEHFVQQAKKMFG